MAKQLLCIAETADSDAVKLAAVKDVLDRAGLKPPAQVQVSAKPLEPWEELIEYASQPRQPIILQITKAQHEAMKRGELLPPPSALPPTDDVVDAELVAEPHAVPLDSTGATCDGEDRAASREPRSADPSAPLSPMLVPSANTTAESAEGSPCSAGRGNKTT